MRLLTVRHITTYRYAEPVGFGDHHLMFRKGGPVWPALPALPGDPARPSRGMPPATPDLEE